MVRSIRSLHRNALAVLFGSLPFIFAGSLAHAAVTSCTVNTTLDDTDAASGTVTAATASGTLRDCILAANLTTGATGKPTLPGMTITFDPAMSGATISLNNDLPLLFNNTTIDASTLASPVAIDGGGAHRIFFVSGLPSTTVGLTNGKPDPDGAQAIAVTLRNLKLQHGLAKGGDAGGFGGGGMGAGGALFVNKSASVTLSGISFAGDVAQGGGGVNNLGDSGGGGMGAGTSFAGGGGGLGSASLANGGAAGLGTAGSGSGGWGGEGLGQLSSVQEFNPASFDVDSGSGTSGLGLIGGGGGIATGGGFGGGGGASSNLGGSGGFGGGGSYYGGSGGFGSGGGSAGSSGGGGVGGFGGGGGLSSSHIAVGGGVGGGVGSGAGFGGAVFVRAGGNLTVQASGASAGIAGGSVTAGNTLLVNQSAAAAGSGMFLMTGVTTTFDLASSYSISDTLADDSLSTLPAGQSYTAGNGAGTAITKQGVGSLVLSGANTYHGATAVNAGVLRVVAPGKIDKSTTTIAAAGTLTGNGTAGPIVSFGTLAPGTSIFPHGTLAVTGALQIQLGALTCFHADAANAISDINVSGNATLNGIARIDFSGGPSVGTTYFPLTAGTVSGAFSGYETNMPNLLCHFTYGNPVTFTVDASDVLFRDGMEQSISDSPCIAAFAD